MKTLRMVRQWTVLMLYSIILVFYWKKGKRSYRYGQQGEWRPGKRRRDWMWGTVVRKGSVRGSRCFGITEQSWGPRAYRGWSVQTQELPRRRERLLRTPRRQGPHWGRAIVLWRSVQDSSANGEGGLSKYTTWSSKKHCSQQVTTEGQIIQYSVL